MKCLLDLDGVLTDFRAASHGFYDVPYSYDEYPYPYGVWDYLPILLSSLGMTADEFWGGLTTDFWATLPWTPDGREILALVESYFTKGNICLLTTPTFSQSAAGKMKWIERELPCYANQFILSPAKSFCASKSSVLIDDADHNLDTFADSGGFTILIPRKWNSLHEKDTLSALEKSLNLLLEYEKKN